MSFRLKKLVIHEGCKYLKTLQPNTYDFLDSNSIDGFYGKNIEITAIVGKNGSGKSSLLEIIFRMMNNISVFIAHGYDVMHRVNNIFVAGIKSDLYYEINGTDCLIECRDTSIALSYSDKKWRFGDVNEEFRNYLNGNSMLIKDKIEMCKYLFFTPFIRFHFIITTHSPFMLSDIRKNNILYLEKGCKIDKEKLLNPFGANINDILAQSFFLEDGFTGDFAKKKILSLLNWLSKNNIKGWDRDTAKQLIESLDEPIIKRHFEYLLSLKNNK